MRVEVASTVDVFMLHLPPSSARRNCSSNVQPCPAAPSAAKHEEMCPGMVGPVDDGMYYCLGKEHGYCDRRSGTCFCNVGYQGISCQDCSPSHYAQGGLCYPMLVRVGREGGGGEVVPSSCLSWRAIVCTAHSFGNSTSRYKRVYDIPQLAIMAANPPP